MRTQSQNQNNRLLLIKNISGITALVIGLGTYGINYFVALKTYPIEPVPGIAYTPIWATRLLYEGCFLALSFVFLGLTIGAKNKIKHLIFYGGCNFYFFLTSAYLLNQFFDVLIRQNKLIFTISLTTISCILYYFYWLFRKH